MDNIKIIRIYNENMGSAQSLKTQESLYNKLHLWESNI